MGATGKKCAVFALGLGLALGGCSPTPNPDGGGATSSAAGRSGGSASPAPTRGEAGTTVRVGGVGDVLIHTPIRENARKNAGGSGFNFNPMFAKVKDVLSDPDVAICHMETPLSADNTNLTVPASMTFNTPHEIAGTLKRAGFDGCDRVSNHVADRGLNGIAQTKQVLEQAGLKDQGPPATSTNRQEPVMYSARGVTIANLAYTYTSLNNSDPNTDLPAGVDWMKYWQWPNVGVKGILADAKRAKQQGAEVVVLSLHWGREYSSTPSSQQLQLAKELLASPDVDAILGAHAHVPQPCQKINGKHVVYGMGNFISNQGASRGLRPQTQDGLIVDLAFTKRKDGTFSQDLTYHPTTVDLSNHQIQLATKETHPDAHKRVTDVVNSLDGSCKVAQ